MIFPLDQLNEAERGTEVELTDAQAPADRTYVSRSVHEAWANVVQVGNLLPTCRAFKRKLQVTYMPRDFDGLETDFASLSGRPVGYCLF